MAMSKAYDFLTKTFASHQNRVLADDLATVGTKISKKEGKELSADADTFADYYKNHRAPGKSVGTQRFAQFAAAKFSSQMKALRTSLEAGPGIDGFMLKKDIADNWGDFISKGELFKFAELPSAHKKAVIKNHYWDFDEIPAGPDTDKVVRTKTEDKSALPATIQNYINSVESKHYVSADPSETPPTASDIKQLKFQYANEVKVDDVVVGYTVRFQGGHYGGIALNADGSSMGDGLGLYEVSPDDAVAFGDLPKQARFDTLRGHELDYNNDHNWNSMSVKDVLATLGSSASQAHITSHVNDALDYVADTLDNDIYYMANVSLHGMGISIDRDFLAQFADYGKLVDHIVEKATAEHGEETGEEVAYALGNGWADIKNPDVEVFEENGEIAGATFRWTVNVDGDHGYWTELVYDAKTEKFIGGATGGYETDTDEWLN